LEAGKKDHDEKAEFVEAAKTVVATADNVTADNVTADNVTADNKVHEVQAPVVVAQQRTPDLAAVLRPN